GLRPLLVRQRIRASGRRSSGIRHEEIDASEGGEGRLHERVDVRRPGHVRADGQDLRPGILPDRGCGLFERRLISGAYRDLASFLRERPGRREAHPLARGRDDGHLAAQAQVHRRGDHRQRLRRIRMLWLFNYNISPNGRRPTWPHPLSRRKPRTSGGWPKAASVARITDRNPSAASPSAADRISTSRFTMQSGRPTLAIASSAVGRNPRRMNSSWTAYARSASSNRRARWRIAVPRKA